MWPMNLYLAAASHHSSRSLSDDSSIASSKASPVQSAVGGFF